MINYYVLIVSCAISIFGSSQNNQQIKGNDLKQSQSVKIETAKTSKGNDASSPFMRDTVSNLNQQSTFVSIGSKSSKEQLQNINKSPELNDSGVTIDDLLLKRDQLIFKGLSTRDVEYELFNLGVRVNALVERIDEHAQTFILPIRAEGKMESIFDRAKEMLPISSITQFEGNTYKVIFLEIPTLEQQNQLYKILGYQGFEFKN